MNSAVYYGLTMSSGNLGSNIYISVFLSGLVEIPAYIAVFLLTDRCVFPKFTLGNLRMPSWPKINVIANLDGSVLCLLQGYVSVKTIIEPIL